MDYIIHINFKKPNENPYNKST
uniref:Uncharacterized protein n=1 Tax=Rhizophora mucronata TaxID=61149 RepID=A0A2P2PXN5_RHIMU